MPRLRALALATLATLAMLTPARQVAALTVDTVQNGAPPFPGAITIDVGGKAVTAETLVRYGNINVFGGTSTDGDAVGDYRTAFAFTANFPLTAGTWSFNPTKVTGTSSKVAPRFLAIVGGGRYIVRDVSGLTNGVWATADLGSDIKAADLVLYGVASAPVPLPIAAVPMLSGLAVFGLLRRSRRVCSA
jgi:hypothetical protein